MTTPATLSGLDAVFLTAASIGGVAVAFKAFRLFRFGDHPRSWALTIGLAYATGAALLSAPVVKSWLDRVTGIRHLAVLLESGMEVGMATAMLALVTYWRLPLRQACSLVWRYGRVFFGLLAVLLVLFTAGSLPPGGAAGFTVHHADDPVVSAFVLTYLAPSTVAILASTRHCQKALRDTAGIPWLRRVLRYLRVVLVCTLLHQLGQVLGLCAAWFDWPDVARAPELCSAIATAGFIPGAAVAVTPDPRWQLRPAIARWFDHWRVFWALRPLHQQLRAVNPAVVFIAQGKRFNPYHRVRRQVLELSEWRWGLAPRFDANLRAAAGRLAAAAGLDGEQARAVVEASLLKAAVHARRTLPGGRPADEDTQDGSGVDDEYRWWVAVATAYRRSRVVAAAVAEGRFDHLRSPR